jgi:hypothetical protein
MKPKPWNRTKETTKEANEKTEERGKNEEEEKHADK